MENEKLSVVRQVVEKGFGNGDLHIIDKLIKENYIEHQFGMKGGKEGLKKAIIGLSTAFSKRKYQLINYSINGNIVWVHYRASGKHTSLFMGHEASGNDYEIDVMDVAKVEEHQITEHWGVPDRFALLTQLGFLDLTKKATP